MQTIQEAIEQLHGALRDYIEATYHISARSLIARRKDLLHRPGVIHQVPYLESTPRYQTGEGFSDMAALDSAALRAFLAVSQSQGDLPKLIYDPPYKHQSQAVQCSLIEGRNLIIMTGTGSGKTESFLLPILGRLAREANSKPDSFARQPAVRALLLYPMNALVNDQLGRLRALFGDPRIVSLFNEWAGRPPRFARYTSRTPYAGLRTARKDSAKFRAFDDFYVDIERRSNDPTAKDQAEARPLDANSQGPRQVASQTEPRRVVRRERQQVAEPEYRRLRSRSHLARRHRTAHATRSARHAARPSGHQLLHARVHDDAADRAIDLRHDASVSRTESRREVPGRS